MVFIYFKVPETKNRTFEEIAHDFAPGGEIEVEEMLDDVFDEPEAIPEVNEHETEEDTHLVSISFDKRNSGPTNADQLSPGSPSKVKTVTVVLPNGNKTETEEERQHLTAEDRVSNI